MKKRNVRFLVLLVSVIIVTGLFFGWHFLTCICPHKADAVQLVRSIELPAPRHRGDMSVEEAIFRRRSIRHYKDVPLTLEEASQLLWAAGGKTIDGITGATRAYPSAGGLYPFEIYLVAGRIEGLSAGIYRFNWREHSISLIREGDFRQQLTRAAHGQRMVAAAPMSIVWVGDFARVRRAYGGRGASRYISMDVGGAGQNVHLQAEALGLATVIIGAFRDGAVKEILGVKDEIPLYIMPVGRPR